MPTKYNVKLIEKIQAGDSIYILRFERGNGWDFDYQPGQFVTAYIPREEKDKPMLMRSYSIASSPSNKKFFELCVKKVEGGPGSTYLCTREVGDIVEFTAPLGKFTMKNTPNKHMFMVATGTGIAPFKSMIEYIYETNSMPGKEIWLFFGARTQKDLVYKELFENLASKHKNFHYIPSLSREGMDTGWKGERGHIEIALEKHLTEPKNTDIYICGLPYMVNETIELGEKKGVPKEFIFTERY
ncbi:MAG: ferredoxin--NADP reductase [Thermoplasmata archaeon]